MSRANQPGRFPRSLAEAFGPHTSHHIEPMRQAPSRAERVASVLLAVALGIFFALFLAHYAAKGY